MPERLYIAKKAENHIRKNFKIPLSIKELCRFIGTSERTLHLGFKERFGVSPKKYTQKMRLNGVRQDLLTNKGKKNVSDTAMQWGFFHLGRFSEQYKLIFYDHPAKPKIISPLFSSKICLIDISNNCR